MSYIKPLVVRKNFIYRGTNNFLCGKTIKQGLPQRILALTLVFIILGCETPASFNTENSTEPAATILDFNTDGPGPGYTGFPNSGESSENNEDLFTPSISANSTLLSADAHTIATTIGNAVSTAFMGAALWQSNNWITGTGALRNNPRGSWYWLIGAGMLIQAATMFIPGKNADETDRKLNAISIQITQIQQSLEDLSTSIKDGITDIIDKQTKEELGKYISELQDAILTTQYLHGNSLHLSQARDTFIAVDNNIKTGNDSVLNTPQMYADACRSLYCSDITAIPSQDIKGINKNTKLLDDYSSLADFIIGANNIWIDGGSAIDTYTTYLSKAYDYNTQTFEKRQKFIDSMYETFETLTCYLLRAVVFDLEFNKDLYEKATALSETLTGSDKEDAESLAADALGNINYVEKYLLDYDGEYAESITTLVGKVGESLKKGQKVLQQEEAIAKFSITGNNFLNEDGLTTYTKVVNGELGGSYDPLIYSYRLKRYLKKDLVEVPAEQYVRYNMGTDYNIEAKWEGNNFRNPSPSQQTALNNKLSERDMNLLKDTAYYRDTNIIDDLTKAGFIFNFSLKDSGSSSKNTFYILGMGGSEATNSPGNYRKIFEKAIVWGAYKQGPQLNSAWTPDGEENVFFDKKIVWKILAINYYDKKTSSTAYSSHGNIPAPDPCVIVYGNSEILPNIVR